MTWLINYELFDDPENAIRREKVIKSLLRIKKEALINEFDPEWKDLYYEIL